MSARFIVGDVFEVLATMPDASVDLVLTSPPFLALRSYLPADHPDKHKEIGSEATPADFLDTLLALTEEWGRVLTPHGSICVELGDSFAGSGGAGGDYADGGRRNLSDDAGTGWPLDKSLCMIPGLYAASLAYGRNLLNPDHTFQPWRVRNLVAWVRPNPPVGALGDKVRPATSYLTWATRARDRWFDLDAVRTPFQGNAGPQPGTKYVDGPDDDIARRSGQPRINTHAGAPPLDWWSISPGGYQGAHYATFPEELCRIPIEASCPRRVCLTCGKPSRRETGDSTYRRNDSDRVPARLTMNDGERLGDGVNQFQRPDGSNTSVTAERETTGWSSCGCPGTDGVHLDGYHTGTGWRPGHVLDPFGGSGTTGVVAVGRGRDCTLIDLDGRNADLARERLGMFLEVVEPTTEGAA